MGKHILYLASGAGRRFGGNKLLHAIEGQPMFLYGLKTLQEVAERIPDCDVTVVSRYGEICQAAEALGFRAVDSPDSEQGISHSIRAGLTALGELPGEDFLLFVVADQPWLTARSVEKLLELAREGTEGACLCWQDRPGNPTLFSARLIPELLALEGDTGGRAVLRKHPCRFVQAASPRELEDVDTPD